MRRIIHTKQPGYLAAVDRSTAIGKAVVDVFSPHGISGQSLPQSKGFMTSTGQVVQSGKAGKVWNYSTAPTDAVWTRDPINPTGGSILLICKPDWALSSGTSRQYVNFGTSSINLKLSYDAAGGQKRFEFSSRGNFGTTIVVEGTTYASDAELQVRHTIVATWRNESSGGANDGTATIYTDNVQGSVSSGIDFRLFGGTSILTMLSSVTGDIELIVFFDRPFSSAEAKALSVNPYRIFQPLIINLPVDVAAAAHTANGAPSMPLPIAAGVAEVLNTASGSPSITAVTASGTGEVKKTATGSPVLPPVAASGTAGIDRSASGAPSIPAITAAGAVGTVVFGKVSFSSVSRSAKFSSVQRLTTFTSVSREIVIVNVEAPLAFLLKEDGGILLQENGLPLALEQQ